MPVYGQEAPSYISEALLFEDASDAVLVLDRATGRIIDVNRQFEVLTGADRASVRGQPADFLVPKAASAAAVVFNRSVYGRPGLHEEVTIARNDGFLASSNVRVIHPEATDIAVCFIRDETERRVLERQLIEKHLALEATHRALHERAVELAALNKELAKERELVGELSSRYAHVARRATLGEIIGEVAHSLNNPLGALTSYLRLLDKSEMSDENQKNYVVRSREAAKRIEVALDELRRACREEVRGAVPVERVDIADEIDGALALLAHRLKDVKVSVDTKPGLLVRASGDDVHYMLLNLLDNAVNATSGRGRIDISAIAEGEAVHILVSDSGPGIQSHVIPRIFEAFFTTRENGTGLGLSMVRRMLDRHQGKIHVEPRGPLGGATFHVILPK